VPWHALLVLAGLMAPQGGCPRAAPRVETLSLTSRTFGNTRSIRVYVPPGYEADSTRRYAVLYLNDGFAVFSPRSWRAPAIADSLICAGVVTPFILVGIDNAASIPGTSTPDHDRTREFLPYPDSLEPDVRDPRGLAYPGFVLDEVMPLIAGRFRVQEGPAGSAVGGASYGGIAALMTVLRYPGRFGGLMLESTPLFVSGRRLLSDARGATDWPARVYIGSGTRETDDSTVLAMASGAQSELVAMLRAYASHTRVVVNEIEGATHSGAAWSARLPAALAFLFPVVRR
jgi:predicted alpha/beta superfamily hydrolase